jgi:hypothetical protein
MFFTNKKNSAAKNLLKYLLSELYKISIAL